jgi:hypothetical protein
MLATMISNIDTSTVYVRLLDEGTDVMRPTSAKKIGSDVYRLIAPEDYDGEYEIWEFVPGSIVRCEQRRSDSGILLVAIEEVQQRGGT